MVNAVSYPFIVRITLMISGPIIHIFELIRDFGPVYGFWSSTVERLNKVLKSHKTNSHEGGELEATFMREFSRNARLRSVVSSSANEGSDKCMY